jgi:hypothetical protein
MNSEPKAFASLSSGLLARKGAARPAMRPQGFGQGGAGLEDLGWNDMGFEAPKPAAAPVRDEDHDAFGEDLPTPALRNPLAALTPVASPVHDQQAEIADRFGAEIEDDDGEDYVDDTAEIYDPEAETETETDTDTDTVETPITLTKPTATVEILPVAPQPIARVVRPTRPRAAPGSKAKAAFTLRLDPARHLKLRLACAVNGRSAQQLVTDALDELLAAIPELESMAERAPKKRAAK